MELLDPAAVKKTYAEETPDWGEVGYVTFKRTYALRLNPDDINSPTEEWWQTCLRVVNGIQEMGAAYTKEELRRLYYYMWSLKGLPSGRAMFKMGTKYVRKYADSLINCWFVLINQPRAFEFVFDQLMMGGGVGFSVRGQDVFQLPRVVRACSITRVDANDADFIVPDSRAGWVELFRRALHSFFYSGKDFTYSLHCIRPKGAPIKGFGGKSSGPEYLHRLVQNTCRLLSQRAGREIRPIDALDICNAIAQCVVAGNVRRSAEIAIGDPSDPIFLDAKQFKDMPDWRRTSNNTVYCSDIDHLSDRFWRNYEKVDEFGSAMGECYGLYNLELAKRFGRLGEERPDGSVVGLNPCGEINLGNFESCNLVELFLPNLDSVEELRDCAELLYRFAKTVCCQNYEYPETQRIVRENMRVGISVSGLLQDHAFGRDIYTVLDDLYEHMREYDEDYSRANGINSSIRLTTVQPSGTKSLLAGTTHGLHAYYSEYAIRRIQMAANEPLVGICRAHGYHVEPLLNMDGSHNFDTSVVSFPTKAPKGAVIAERQTALEQMDLIKNMQAVWADNSCSSTVTYKPEEVPVIKDWLKQNFKESVKSISFLRHEGHGFKQAPYEPISEETYWKMKAGVQPIVKVNVNTEVEDDQLSGECKGGVCASR